MRQKPDLSAQPSDSQVGCDSFILASISRKEKLAMSTEENKKLVLHWKEEVWNKRNLNIMDELYSTDYIGHIVGAPGPVRGREELKQLLTVYFAAFDIHLKSEFLIAEGDMVAVYDTVW